MRNFKNDLKISKRRSQIHFLYRSFRKFFIILKRYRSKPIKSILYYPVIEKKTDLIDIINRLSYSFPYKKDIVIYLPINKNLRNVNIGLNFKHIKYICSNEILKYLNSDAIFVHNAPRILDFPILSKLYKTQIVDKNYYAEVELSTYASLYYYTFNKYERNSFLELSKKNYLRLLKKIDGFKDAFCFARGPSFDKVMNFKYPFKSFKIICNSIVKDQEFLKYIKNPHLITFGDPGIFGLSKYGAEIQKLALEFVKKYDSFIMVPEGNMPLLLAHHSSLRDNIIGIPTNARFYNFPSLDLFFVKSDENQLTSFMIPVASAVAKNIYIIGADGMNNKDKKFSWKNSNSTMLNNKLLQNLYDLHPSFYRDSINVDYQKYNKCVKDIIEYGESLKKKYYSLTPSYIPALSKRIFLNKEISNE